MHWKRNFLSQNHSIPIRYTSTTVKWLMVDPEDLFACSRNNAMPFVLFWWRRCCWTLKINGFLLCWNTLGNLFLFVAHRHDWPERFYNGQGGSCHLLWALKLLKLCASKSTLCALAGGVDEKTFCKWSWHVVLAAGNTELISDRTTKNYKISY